jgi:hypothetical protein
VHKPGITNHFNWLVMSTPLNVMMLCGDAELPDPATSTATATQ